jgi:hypothetical protein
MKYAPEDEGKRMGVLGFWASFILCMVILFVSSVISLFDLVWNGFAWIMRRPWGIALIWLACIALITALIMVKGG